MLLRRDSLKNYQYIAVKLACCLILFAFILLHMPDFMPQPIEAGEIIRRNRGYIGLIIVVASLFVITVFFNYSLDLLYAKIKSSIKIKSIKKKLSLLNLQERALLREFFLRGSSTLIMPTEERTVKTLIQSGIIDIVAEPEIEGDDCCECRISLDARSMLTRAQLMLPKEHLSSYEVDKLFSRRPYFSNIIRKPKERPGGSS